MASQEEAAAGKSTDYHTWLKKAQLAETCERYGDMADYMVEALKANGNKFDVEGRTNFQIAFKNEIGKRRAAIRAVDGAGPGEEAKELRSKVVVELEELCGKVLGHIQTLLDACPKESEDKAANEDKINYLKMIGDYNRYRAEYLEGESQKTVKEAASEAYKAAVNLAKEALEETDPTRLGLMLNYSVFNYEVLKNRDQACTLAKTAFDAAIAKLDTLNDTSYKDSTLIMQLLRDNLTLWTSENDDKTNNQEED